MGTVTIHRWGSPCISVQAFCQVIHLLGGCRGEPSFLCHTLGQSLPIERREPVLSVIDGVQGRHLFFKDIFEISWVHHPPYIATVSPRHPVDLARKFEKAKSFKGLKLFLTFAPCPTGWLYDPAKTQECAKLGSHAGSFRCKRRCTGR